MKKLNKMQKFIISALSIFIGVAVIFGLSINVLQTCAEENSAIIETSAETPDISTDSATDEEVIINEETSENSGVLNKETGTETDNIAILDEIKDYLDSRKDESGKIDFKMILTDVKFWIIQAISFLAQTGVGVAILGLINRKNKKDNVLTDAHVERVATAAAKKTAESIVGKSIDVDISAEVSKAVKKELYTLSASMDSLVDGVKNTEMLVAREAVALSHSRILGANEKTALLEGAKKAEAHAGKVVSTAKIEITAPQEKDFETIMSEIKEKCGDCEAWSGTDCTRNFYTQGCLKDEKNIHYLKFNRGEKK